MNSTNIISTHTNDKYIRTKGDDRKSKRMNNKHTPQSNHAKQQECSAKDSESVPKQLDELQTVNN